MLDDEGAVEGSSARGKISHLRLVVAVVEDEWVNSHFCHLPRFAFVS
jgi:hypothetical protein